MTQYTYEIIEIVISTLSLLSCFFMIYIYKKHPQFKMFSYATQFYILLGAFLSTVLDFIFNSYYLDALKSNQEPCQVAFQTSMCQITSYVSTYGIMSMVCWQTVLVSVTKQAVLQRKTEQFSGHIYIVTYAFFGPLMFTIIPQLSNESIYGPYENVCWLQYNYTAEQNCPNSTNTQTHKTQSNKSYDIIIFSLLFFFIPIIFQCIKQLIDIRDIEIDIRKMQSTFRRSEVGQQNSHIKAIKSLKILPAFFLIIVTIPAILFFLQIFKIHVNQWIFQIFKGMLSATALILLFVFSRNNYLVQKCKETFKKKPKNDDKVAIQRTLLNNKLINKNQDIQSEQLIDLFQGIEK